MASDASWWTDPEAGKSGDQGAPVVRHAPDGHNYHVPDGEMLGKMPRMKSRSGRFAIIPAANKDGSSKGFDPTVAGPVHVDPDAPDGGVVFDPDAVRKSDVNRAVAHAVYPHQAYYQLGVSAAAIGVGRRGRAAAPAAPARDNPHLPPGAYIVPSADPVQGPAPYEDVPVNPMPSFPQPAPIQHPQPAAMVPQFSHAGLQPPAPAQPLDPNLLLSMMHSMQQQLQAVVATQRAAAASQPFPTTGLSPSPMPVGLPALATTPVEVRHRQAPQPAQGRGFEDESARPIRKRRGNEEGQEVSSVVRRRPPQDEPDPPQTVGEYERATEEDRDAVIVGFEALKVKWLNGPLASKPKFQVIFELPQGKVMPRYHDVLVGEGNVTLVYDTRYEDGFLYDPPDLQDATFKVHVPKLKKTFTVSSMGMKVAFGVFDMIILVKQDEEALDYSENE
jgi:hypothetical protein